MTDFKKLKMAILDDGIIDEQEVKQLKEILYEDGIIDQEEADFLFDLNDAVSGKKNHPDWERFFVDAICDFLLKDEISPGEIDDNECAWLVDKIEGDGQVDKIEKKLLLALKEKSTNFPKSLAKLLK